MNFLLGTIFLLLTTFSKKGFAKNEDLTKEFLERLLNSPSYDKRIAPPNELDPGSPINVTVTMYVLDISKVDTNNQEFEAQFYFRQGWADPRLKFPDAKLKSVVLRDVDKIWTPDLFFVNEKKGELNKMLQPNIFCKINNDGRILYSVRVTEKLQCSMDLRNFPHDTQKCEIIAESYGFTRDVIDLNWGTQGKPVGVSPNITENEFLVQEAMTEVSYIKLVSGNYSQLVLRLTFQRRFGHYARHLYAPLIVLVLLSWLSFWIKAKEKYIRLILLLVILYLTVTIASEVEPTFPKTPYTKASDVWTGFCAMMVLAAFLEFIASCIIATEAEETRAKHKSEILYSVDPEEKETHLNVEMRKSGFGKYFVMFQPRNGAHDLPNRIDRISRVLFPTVFFLFNVIYWAVCCT